MSLSGWSFPIFSFFVMMPAARCQFAVNLPLQPVQIADPQHQKSDMQWIFEQDFEGKSAHKTMVRPFRPGAKVTTTPRHPPHRMPIALFHGPQKGEFSRPHPQHIGPLRQMVYFGGGPRLVWIKAVLCRDGLGFIYGGFRASLGLVQVLFLSIQDLFRVG